MNLKNKKIIGDYLKGLVIKASSGTGEDNTGAYLTRPEILHEILAPDYMSGTIYERCRHYDVSDKANGLFMTIAKQTNRTIASGILGGFTAYHIDEGVPVTPSRGAFHQDQIDLHQIGVICRVTNALRQDSLVLTQYLGEGLKETLQYWTDYEILYGDGSTGCNGILNTGDRTTKYITAANPLTIQNIKDMVKWYYGGKNGAWVMGRDIYYEVENLFANTLALKYKDSGEALLFGYPIIRKDTVNARCCVLGDWSQFLVVQKPIREEVSDQVYFDSNESVFRTIYRLGGLTTWYSPITEQSGQISYPFVSIDTQDTRSSSSSSSSSSHH